MTNLKDPCFDATPSLASAFERHFPIGVAVEPRALKEQGPLVAHHFRRLTAENAMKLGEVCRTPARYDFSRADALANFARAHSMTMTGHTFVWHRMVPQWLFESNGVPVSRSTIEQHLRNHIFTMTERYSNVVDNWDVVNEAVSDEPQQLWRDAKEGSGWHAAFAGEGYVAQAFRDATEAATRYAPHVKLYYNDYDLEKPHKRHKTIAMLRSLRSQGVRVDGVGLQGHINLNWPTQSELIRAIEEFAEQDLLVKISELDVSVYCNDDSSEQRFENELGMTPELDLSLGARYRDIFSVLKQCAAKLTSVTFWGLSDRLSWLNYWPLKRKNYPLLFDGEDRAKTAFYSVIESA